jgi:hypothetical protein
MGRSRSSFDLKNAIATAASLTPEAAATAPKHYAGVALVSFERADGSDAAPRVTRADPAPPPAPAAVATAETQGAAAPPGTRGASAPGARGAPALPVTHAYPPPPVTQAYPPPSAPRPAAPPVTKAYPVTSATPADAPAAQHGDARADPTRPVTRAEPAPGAARADAAPDSPPGAAQQSPPKLPDLSAVVSPILRCEKIVAWIGEATGATDVFLADAAGLPLAGAFQDAEARLAGAGVVASSIASLASALPGSASPLFEVHIGEGPFFQLIGFQAGAALYVIGLTRATPLNPRQAHAIRLACRHALGETLRGGA